MKLFKISCFCFKFKLLFVVGLIIVLKCYFVLFFVCLLLIEKFCGGFYVKILIGFNFVRVE